MIDATDQSTARSGAQRQRVTQQAAMISVSAIITASGGMSLLICTCMTAPTNTFPASAAISTLRNAVRRVRPCVWGTATDVLMCFSFLRRPSLEEHVDLRYALSGAVWLSRLAPEPYLT